MVVLVNRYSASASEIVSACLQDHKRAVDHGRADLGQGERAEHHRAGGRPQRLEADHGRLLPPQRQEHPPLPRLQGRGRMGRDARPGLRSAAERRRDGGLAGRPPRARRHPPASGRLGPDSRPTAGQAGRTASRKPPAAAGRSRAAGGRSRSTPPPGRSRRHGRSRPRGRREDDRPSIASCKWPSVSPGELARAK